LKAQNGEPSADESVWEENEKEREDAIRSQALASEIHFGRSEDLRVVVFLKEN